MTTKPAETTEAPAEANVSKKRQITAAVTSTTVSVALGLAATAGIEFIASRVRKAIAPESK
jgi:hypothetical protein